MVQGRVILIVLGIVVCGRILQVNCRVLVMLWCTGDTSRTTEDSNGFVEYWRLTGGGLVTIWKNNG